MIPEQNAIPFDPSISYEQGAMFEPSTVALHGLLQNDYQGGRCVAILGCGTIGIFTMQWAKIFGSKKVVVFDISDERLDLALRMGADAVVNTTKENFMEEAMAITGDKGYLRQQDRYRLCIWHLSLQQTRLMYASSERLMQI